MSIISEHPLSMRLVYGCLKADPAGEHNLHPQWPQKLLLESESFEVHLIFRKTSGTNRSAAIYEGLAIVFVSTPQVNFLRGCMFFCCFLGIHFLFSWVSWFCLLFAASWSLNLSFAWKLLHFRVWTRHLHCMSSSWSLDPSLACIAKLWNFDLSFAWHVQVLKFGIWILHLKSPPHGFCVPNLCSWKDVQLCSIYYLFNPESDILQ